MVEAKIRGTHEYEADDVDDDQTFLEAGKKKTRKQKASTKTRKAEKSRSEENIYCRNNCDCELYIVMDRKRRRKGKYYIVLIG